MEPTENSRSSRYGERKRRNVRKETKPGRKTYRNTIPIFINHHDAQQYTEREEKQSIDVMLNCIANCHTERKQQDLTSSIKCCTEDDITDWPSVFKSTEDQDKLGDDVYRDADERPDDVDYEESNGFGV